MTKTKTEDYLKYKSNNIGFQTDNTPSQALDPKTCLHKPEVTSIELRTFVDCPYQFEDCTFIKMDDLFSNHVYLRAKIKNKMDFKVIKVVDLDLLEN